MDAFARQGLVRPRHGRVVAGVCAGIARRIGLGPWLTRILFLLVNTLIPGSFPRNGRRAARTRPV